MIGSYLTHNHGADLISSIWGSYFYYPDPKKVNIFGLFSDQLQSTAKCSWDLQ